MKKILVLFNKAEKNSLESEKDTEESAMWVENILKKLNYQPEMLGITKNNINEVKKIKADLVFNLIEWTGKETKFAVQTINILDKLKIPYTGSNVVGYKLVCDKKIMKQKMVKQGIPTPKYQVFSSGKEKFLPIPFPIIVKPVFEHCGVGVNQNSIVDNFDEYKKIIFKNVVKLKRPMLAEQFIEGREFHVTVLEKKGNPWVLPPGEVVFSNKEGFRHVLTYEGKWKEKSDEYKLSEMVLAKIDKKLFNKIQNIAKDAYVKLGGRDYPRLDLRYDGKNIYVLEINNNPGIDYSLESGIGVSARAVKMGETELVDHIIKNTYYRFKKMKNATN